MKICIFAVTIDKSYGGPARSIPALACGLSQVGIDTTLMVKSTSDMNTHVIENSTVKFKPLASSVSNDELKELIVGGGYDVIHCQEIWYPLYHRVAVICRKYNIPYIITPRGTLEPWSLSQKRIKKMIAWALYQKRDLQKASCILATASMEAQHIRDLKINTPIAIIPNGIDVSDYPCRKYSSLKFIKKQLLFLSRIHPKKGIEFLIKSWEILSAKYPDWKVIIAGNGDDAYIEKLNNQIVKCGLENNMSIIPPQYGADKYKLYYESSLFVLPSYSENFGMVIAEAMSCGVPVITTNGTPWQDLNVRKIGWCIDLSESNLTSALSQALELGQEKLFDMGQKASEYVLETYQHKQVAIKNMMLYNWIISGKDKPNYII